MTTKLLFLSIAILIFANLFSQEWTVTEIGTCPNDKAYGICLGDGHNDGTNRIYVSTRGEATDGAIYEWTWNGSAWQMTATVGTGLRNLVTITLGDARNDGVTRLYAVEWGGTSSNVYEYTWSGSAWNRVTLASPTKPMLSVVVGDARGDGINRLYVGGWIIQREYFWNGSSWTSTDISTAHGTEGPVFFGVGRNDGKIRYYTPGNHVKEFSWNGTAWADSSSVSTSLGWPETVAVTDGRNDGVQRIYTQDNSGTHEITRSGSSWVINTIEAQSGRSFLFSAKTKSDGKNYIYSTDVGSPMREYKYNSGTGLYEYTTIDAASGATALIDAGAGRNDNIVRIYTPGYATGKIYEITNTSPFILSVPPVISGDNMLCPEGTGQLSTGLFDTYQWFRRYYGSSDTEAIPNETGQSLSMGFYDYAASYITVKAGLNGHYFMSAEFFVDGYAFAPATVVSTGEYTVGTSGEFVLCAGDEMYFTLNSPYTTNIVWYKDGSPIAGQTGQTLTVTEPGNYYVEGAPVECPAFIQGPGVNLEVVSCDPSGITTDGTSVKSRLYPNPADSYTRIFPGAKYIGASYKITDSSGRIAGAGICDEDGKINCSDLSRGVYFISFDKYPDIRLKLLKN
ncbi:MAG: T9SS type A sorting domain-containing protein [Bacteroidales bacterium]|nr:T9SS type A sorting domain-containing protein [Bacteroidales bacterium]